MVCSLSRVPITQPGRREFLMIGKMERRKHINVRNSAIAWSACPMGFLQMRRFREWGLKTSFQVLILERTFRVDEEHFVAM